MATTTYSSTYKPARVGRVHATIPNTSRELWRQFRTEAFSREMTDAQLFDEILGARYAAHPTGGTFTLVMGRQKEELPHDATPAAIQAAIDAMEARDNKSAEAIKLRAEVAEETRKKKSAQSDAQANYDKWQAAEAAMTARHTNGKGKEKT